MPVCSTALPQSARDPIWSSLVVFFLLSVVAGIAQDQPVSPAETPSRLIFTEITTASFNPCGIEVLPFPRIAFCDFDGDGRQELMAGSKDGRLLLYGSTDALRWHSYDGYFTGIKAGALCAPTAGDLDGDGAVELVIGTGGFSSNSGRIQLYHRRSDPAGLRWEMVTTLPMDVGDDAAPAVVDYNFDGLPDLIVGNSEGRLSFFRNLGGLRFAAETPPLPLRRSYGMYATPSAAAQPGKIVLAVGTDQGGVWLYQFTRQAGRVTLQVLPARLRVRNFASPAFTDLLQAGRLDLVVADGDGGLEYYEQRGNTFTLWAKSQQIFQNRLETGPASAPSLAIKGTLESLVVGNIDGTFRLFRSSPEAGMVPWREERGYFDPLRVAGFSHGVLTEWDGREMLVAGESGGGLRAYLRATGNRLPRWREAFNFFSGVRVAGHSAPCLFDLDRDGGWELITGAADGRLHVYRVRATSGGWPVWEPVAGALDRLKVTAYSSPALAWHGESVEVFVGQQDGRIRTFRLSHPGAAGESLEETHWLDDLVFRQFPSPAVRERDGQLELIVGDYDGNLRHFLAEWK